MTRGGPITLPFRNRNAPRVLWIGARQKTGSISHGLGDLLHLRPSQILTISIGDIDADLMTRVSPTMVCSMLTWIGGDVLEAAVALDKAGYAGEYWVFGPNLPEPDIIQAEVLQSAPNIAIRMITSVRARR